VGTGNVLQNHGIPLWEQQKFGGVHPSPVHNGVVKNTSISGF